MQQMCQKLRQMRQKVGNRELFMKAIAFPNPGQERRSDQLAGAGSRYGLPYLFVGPKMSKGEEHAHNIGQRRSHCHQRPRVMSPAC